MQLGAAGATVYVTGRTSRSKRSEMNRPETIEETAALVDEAGGRGIAVQVDHLVHDEVCALVTRIEGEQGGLHVLVNDIWGAEIEWNKSVWESSLDTGLRTLRLAVDTHAITSHFAIPLLIKTPGGLVVEINDGTAEYNETHYRVSFFYDLAKASVLRMAFALAHELQPYSATAVSLTPGWLRSEVMLENHGVTESNWRDATTRTHHFAISESPAFVGRAVAALAQDPNVSRWNGKSLSSGQLAKIYGFTDMASALPRPPGRLRTQLHRHGSARAWRSCQSRRAGPAGTPEVSALGSRAPRRVAHHDHHVVSSARDRGPARFAKPIALERYSCSARGGLLSQKHHRGRSDHGQG